MTTTLKILDMLKASTPSGSDYAVSKILGCTAQTVSHYRHRGNEMSDSMAIRACEALGIDPAPHLLALRVERAKCDAEKVVWHDILNRLGGLAA